MLQFIIVMNIKYLRFTKYFIYISFYLLTPNANGDYYKNPLITDYTIADPCVIKTSSNKYYCYGTSAWVGYCCWTSRDLVHWVRNSNNIYKETSKTWGAAFSWWAPEVEEYQGKYYLYYTVKKKTTNSLRIGVAVSNSPEGPFIDVYNHPLFDFGYAVIDANVFIDDNSKKYLYYVRDCSENIVNGNHESHIYVIELSSNMLSVVGSPTLLLRPSQPWEMKSGPDYYWNEGPYVFKRGGRYYLMYSANYYNSRDYGVGYAISQNPRGPFTKSGYNPVLHNVTGVSGPGHNSAAFSPDNSERFIVYHTHKNATQGNGERQVCIDRMNFRADGSIEVAGPTLSNQPMPSGSE